MMKSKTTPKKETGRTQEQKRTFSIMGTRRRVDDDDSALDDGARVSMAYVCAWTSYIEACRGLTPINLP